MTERRFSQYLATGVLPDKTALDESLEEHDKKYHGGKFDPSTMECGKRDGMEKGDGADEVEEDPKSRHERLVNKVKETGKRFFDEFDKVKNLKKSEHDMHRALINYLRDKNMDAQRELSGDPEEIRLRKEWDESEEGRKFWEDEYRRTAE